LPAMHMLQRCRKWLRSTKSSGTQVKTFASRGQEDDWDAVLPRSDVQAPSWHNFETSPTGTYSLPRSQSYSGVPIPSTVMDPQDACPSAPQMKEGLDQDAHTPLMDLMDGIWQARDPSALLPDLTIFIIKQDKLITASGKRYVVVLGPTKGTILLGDGVISLDPDGSIWLRTKSGTAVQYKHVSMPSRSNLCEMQGSWVYCDAKLGTTMTLLIQGVTWCATSRRCTTHGVLRLKNGAVLVNDTTAKLSSTGQLKLKDLRFRRTSFSGSLARICE